MRTRNHAGFSSVEVLIALALFLVAVVATGQMIVATLALVGRGTSDAQQAARARSEGVIWIQAVTEYARKVGFNSLAASCPNLPCTFSIPADTATATPPFDRGPSLPGGLQCGRVTLADWNASVSATDLRLATVEVYRGTCPPSGLPFMSANDAIGAR
jgi:Tfp pilus assembly protein PilW